MKLFASDLDQTLIYSKRWLSNLEDDDAVDCVEVYNNNNASFMLSKSSQRLYKIHSEFNFIPVTTRTVSQYKRIQFKYTHPEIAVVANGGIILIDGKPDPQWKLKIEAQLNNVTSMDSMIEKIQRLKALEGFKLLNKADDLFFYIVMHSPNYDKSAVEFYSDYFEENGWHIHFQGRKIYFMPHCISKGQALLYLKEQYGYCMIVSAGDSSLDESMQTASDYFIIPKHSSLTGQIKAPENGLHSGLYILEKALSLLRI